MSLDWQQFLTTHASAVFALLGAFGGGVLSFIASLWLKQRDFKLQLRSKLMEKQIHAHETVMALALELRTMYGSGEVDSKGELKRAPRILSSKSDFESWFTKFSEQQVPVSSWLSTAAKREVNFVQDYLVTLHTHLSEVPEANYFALGDSIRQDFIGLSSALEKRTFQFFRNGMGRSKPDSLEKWHKYPPSKTLERLNAMRLLVEIERFKIKGRGGDG